MPVTREQADLLAALAVACRPHGAPRWDAPGVVAAISKVSQLALPDVAMAVIRAAADRTLETPANIARTTSSHWSEKVADRARPFPPKSHESCRLCGRHLDSCICGEQQTRPPARVPPNDAWAEARASMRSSDEVE